MTLRRCLLAGAALVMMVGPVAHAQRLQIDAGMIEGRALENGVRTWFGVPFAAPPVRDLRWKPPQPVTPWQGMYRADRSAPMCLQPLRFRTMNHYFGNEATSEDCLYLNIWAPPAGEKHPVLVWIYGGGFTVGSASMANYAGAALAAKGAVQVNIAYRVGTMGFFSHPELSREGAGASGNYGLMDQIAALRWVQRNISAFGGDPGNVTIMGQSAGSMSVALLQSSPAARALFHKVIGMSGSPFGALLAPVPLAEAEADGVRLQQALGASGIEAMRDLPGDRIAAAPFARRGPIAIDGAVLREAPVDSFKGGRHNDVPALLGFTRDENFRSIGPVKTVADYQAAVRATWPDQSEAILKYWPAKSDAAVARAKADLERDASLGVQMAGWAKAQKSPSWGWLFTRRQPYSAGVRFADHDPATVGVYHTGDVPYWLGTLDALNLFRTTRDWTEMDRALSQRMQGMILSFARTGTPGADWPRFDPKKPQLLELGEQIRPVPWPRFRALDLLSDAKPAVAAPDHRRPRD